MTFFGLPCASSESVHGIFVNLGQGFNKNTCDESDLIHDKGVEEESKKVYF